MNPSPRHRLAIHEGGHAIIATLLGLHPVSFTLLPDGKGGHVHHGPANEMATEGCRAEIAVAVAGVVAERIAFRHKQAVMDSDGTSASRAAARIHGTRCTTEQIQDELIRGEQTAEMLLRAHWPAVKKLARHMEKLYGLLDDLANLLLTGGHQDRVAAALQIAGHTVENERLKIAASP